MMTSLRWVLVAALMAPSVVFAQSEAEAGDISEVDKDRVGPLRERVRPVSGHVFRKEGRFEFSPSVTLSLKDAFFTKYIFGAAFTYHLSDSFGVGARLGYGLNAVSGAAQICNTQVGDVLVRGCRSPDFKEVDGRAPGQIKLVGGLDAQWAPIYAKLAFVAESFLAFDMYAVGGGSVVQYGGPGTGGSTDKLTFGGNAGLGARVFLSRWMTLRTELRDLIYMEPVGVERDNQLRNQLLFELGFSMFFPTLFSEK